MQLTPEQVNEFLANEILRSSIGQAVDEAIKKVLTNMTRSFDNPFELVIKGHINTMVDKLITIKYRAEIEQQIDSAIKKFITEDFIHKVVDAGLEKIRRNY